MRCEVWVVLFAALSSNGNVWGYGLSFRAGYILDVWFLGETDHPVRRPLSVLSFYLVAFIYILFLIIWNFFAWVLRTLTAGINAIPDAAFDKRAFPAKIKYPVKSSSAAVEFIKRDVKAKILFIKGLGLSSQGIVISLHCDICSASGTVMSAVTWWGLAFSFELCRGTLSGLGL